jgi:hypothetical protein
MVGFVLAVVLLGVFWKWVVTVVVITTVAIVGRRLWRSQQATAARLAEQQAAIAARADEQHQWYIEGDERGTYGTYPPPEIGSPPF